MEPVGLVRVLGEDGLRCATSVGMRTVSAGSTQLAAPRALQPTRGEA